MMSNEMPCWRKGCGHLALRDEAFCSRKCALMWREWFQRNSELTRGSDRTQAQLADEIVGRHGYREVVWDAYTAELVKQYGNTRIGKQERRSDDQLHRR